MSTIVQTSFDYTTVSTEQALALRMAAERVRLRLKRTAEDIIAIGHELIAVKADLDHGQFLGWLQLEFEMSESAALKFMHVAHRFESKSVIITDLPITILYQLSAPLLAEDIALTVAEQITIGEIDPTNKAVKAAIDEAKEAKALLTEAKIQHQIVQQQFEISQQAYEDHLARANEEIQVLTTRLDAIQDELDQQTTPEAEIREVVPESITRQIAMLNDERQQLTQRVADLMTKNADLGKLHEELSTQLKQSAIETHERDELRRFHLGWRAHTSKICATVGDLLMKLPTTTAAQQFEQRDWDGLHDAQHAVAHLQSLLQQYESHQFVDAKGYIDAG